jgi:hypothetical protein
VHSEISKGDTRYGRLKAIGAGLVLLVVGLLLVRGGVQVVTHWRTANVFVGRDSGGDCLHTLCAHSEFVGCQGCRNEYQQKGKMSVIAISQQLSLQLGVIAVSRTARTRLNRDRQLCNGACTAAYYHRASSDTRFPLGRDCRVPHCVSVYRRAHSLGSARCFKCQCL